jgi:hypothetical protein
MSAQEPRARACARYGVLVVGEEMKGLRPAVGIFDGPRTNTDNGGNCPEMSGACFPATQPEVVLLTVVSPLFIGCSQNRNVRLSIQRFY